MGADEILGSMSLSQLTAHNFQEFYDDIIRLFTIDSVFRLHILPGYNDMTKTAYDMLKEKPRFMHAGIYKVMSIGFQPYSHIAVRFDGWIDIWGINKEYPLSFGFKENIFCVFDNDIIATPEFPYGRIYEKI